MSRTEAVTEGGGSGLKLRSGQDPWITHTQGSEVLPSVHRVTVPIAWDSPGFSTDFLRPGTPLVLGKQSCGSYYAPWLHLNFWRHLQGRRVLAPSFEGRFWDCTVDFCKSVIF